MFAAGRSFVEPFKCGKTRSFLTESAFWGEALKDRSEGGWRSGRRRSGGCWRRGHGNDSVCFRVVPGYPLSTRCATKQLLFGFDE